MNLWHFLATVGLILILAVPAAAQSGIGGDRLTIHAAAERGDVDALAKLLRKHKFKDINDFNDEGFAPIHLASRWGHVNVVLFLATAHADVNLPDRDHGHTALMLAARHGRGGALQGLLQNGADVNKMDKEGHTALHYAAEKGISGIVEILLHFRPDVNLRDATGETPLCMAAASGKTTVIKILLAAGADLTIADNDGYLPIHRAAASGQSEAVKTLIAAGADPNSKAADGTTPLHRAADKEQINTVAELLLFGANPNGVNEKTGMTPLLHAAFRDNPRVALILLAKGADPNSQTTDTQMTALHFFTSKRNLKGVRILMKYGANPNLSDANGRTPVSYVEGEDRADLKADLKTFLEVKDNPDLAPKPEAPVAAEVPATEKPAGDTTKTGTKAENAHLMQGLEPEDDEELEKMLPPGFFDNAPKVEFGIIEDDAADTGGVTGSVKPDADEGTNSVEAADPNLTPGSTSDTTGDSGTADGSSDGAGGNSGGSGDGSGDDAGDDDSGGAE